MIEKNSNLFIDEKVVVIRGYTEFILDLEKEEKIKLIVVDNSDFASLYLIRILDETLLNNKDIKDRLFKDIEELNR